SVLGAGSIALEKHFEIPALKPPRFLIESISGPPHRRPSPETSPTRIADAMSVRHLAPES
ncbi:MAG TPA: hypothetical protein VJK29_09760, partial [Terriglobales bacterium]|nr:hypothetical protein [Terriglobales bacterium]